MDTAQLLTLPSLLLVNGAGTDAGAAVAPPFYGYRNRYYLCIKYGQLAKFQDLSSGRVHKNWVCDHLPFTTHRQCNGLRLMAHTRNAK